MANIVHSAAVDMKSVTLTLRLPHMFSFRMWLTAKLLFLAGLVSPITIEAEWKD